MGPTPPSPGRAIPSRAVSPTDSRVTVVIASPRTLQAMARAAILLMARARTQAMELSQLPRDMARLAAMAVARAPNRLTGSSPPTLAMASSQLPAAPREVTVAVLRAAAMGSPRVGATASSLAMVDSSKAMDSSKAIIPLRAMDSRTSTTAAVVVEVEVEVEVTMAKINPP
uniref:AltFUS n=1 Tax=Homo sapiens TaxID=9606 RepID=A0A823ADP9_HUMAN|nr:TPA_exp: altFUS [Homo sapiens]